MRFPRLSLCPHSFDPRFLGVTRLKDLLVFHLMILLELFLPNYDLFPLEKTNYAVIQQAYSVSGFLLLS